jgi:hypothetical protein
MLNPSPSHLKAGEALLVLDAEGVRPNLFAMISRKENAREELDVGMLIPLHHLATANHSHPRVKDESHYLLLQRKRSHARILHLGLASMVISALSCMLDLVLPHLKIAIVIVDLQIALRLGIQVMIVPRGGP